MNDLVEKISTYNLFNNLFPGVLFAFIASEVTAYNFVQEDLLTGLFFYYFIGLVISRIGSLVIEPILKLVGFVEFADYKNFITTSKKDGKITQFSEINNMYRTVSTMLLMVLLLKAFESLSMGHGWSTEIAPLSLVALLVALFLLSYRKQTSYINKRISKALDND